MITLITGVPGAGKTLNTIKAIDREVQNSDRQVFVAGVAELNIPGWHSVDYERLHQWETLPSGSIVLCDEADQFAPTRGNRGDPPAYIRELARHRHLGLDFYFITQRPKMLDHHLRGLVGRHLHYERAFNRNSARCLSWEQCVDDPNDHHARKLAVTTRVAFDKSYFGKYKSAEVHTHKPRLPAKVWLVAAGLVVCVGLGIRLINDIQSRHELVKEGASDPDPLEVLASGDYQSVGMGSYLEDADGQKYVSTETYIALRQPRVLDMPYSAPLYDGVTEVKTYPRPQCIYSHRTDRCQCYTQQATPLDMTYEVCRDIVDNGWFNPYRDESDQSLQLAATGAGDSGAFRASGGETPPGQPRIVYIGGNKNEPPVVLGPDEFLADRTNQPGAAYRNPGRVVPTQPAQPGVGSRPSN